ncbi:hypothetical protein ElyMa_000183700, partial [Elysia marginata]
MKLRHTEEMDELTRDIQNKHNQVDVLDKENQHMRAQIQTLKTSLTSQQEHHDAALRQLTEDKIYQEEQYTTMLGEMSNKIQQLEDATNASHDMSEDEEEKE